MIAILLGHARKILILLMVIFAFGLTYLPSLSFDASSDSLVLENDADVLFFKKLRATYPSSESLIIAYHNDNHVLDAPVLEHITQLVSQLNALREVESTTSILNVPLFESPKLGLTELGSKRVTIENGKADLALLREEFRTSPLYSNNLVSASGNTTAILVTIAPQNKAQAIQQIREVLAQHSEHATLYLGGVSMIVHDVISYIASDLVYFSIAVIGVMALVLLVIFRSLRFMLMPLGISLIVALSTTAIVAMLGWNISVISSNFFSLLLVLTLAVVIHLIVRYRELYSTHTNSKEVLVQTLQQMAKPCAYTSLTTLIAFISLMVSGIRPVIDFGYIMAIGVSLAFILGFVLFAVMQQLLPRMAPSQVTTTSITSPFARFTDHSGTIVVLLSVAFALITTFGITKISVENKFIDYFTNTTEIYQGLSLIDDELGGTIDIEIIFNDIGTDYFYDSFIREDIAKVHGYLENRAELGKVLSIDTLMQLLTQANDGTKLSGFFLNIAKNSIEGEAKTQIYDPYINEERGELRIIARVKENYPELNRQELLQSIEADIVALGFSQESFRISGMMVLYNNMLRSLFDSQIQTIGAVFLLIWLMFVIVFRSLKLATIAIIPNILPALGIIGIMGLLGISLDLMTITIASIAIGIGVDNAIHYITRYTTELERGKSAKESMYLSHASIGVAMFYTALTVIIGFMVLTFSNFVPSIYFGIFTSIAMLSAILLNLTLLPKLLTTFVKH